MTYIDSILAKAYKKNWDFLKNYKVSHKTLSVLLTTFIRPYLDYACEIWSGCSYRDCDKLEKLQLAGARNVTGLTLLASRDYLYFETWWEPYADRRRTKIRSIMYKIHYDMAPEYLQNIKPNIRLK